MRILIYIMVSLCIGSLSGQNPLFIHMAEDGIHLRWQGVRDTDFEGYNVYRRIGNGDWELLTETPLRLVQSSNEAVNLSGAKNEILYGLLEKTGGAIRADELVNASANARLFESTVIVNPELAWMLGERYTDLSAVRGQTYAYRVTWIRNGDELEWQESSQLKAYQPDAVPPPGEIDTRESDGEISLSLEANRAYLRSGEAISWNIYRSESQNGDYQKINFENYFPFSIDTKAPTLSFSDRFLENGKTYYYRVKMINVTGNESNFSRTYALTPRKSVNQGILNFSGEILASKAVLLWEMEESGIDLEIWKQSGPKQEFQLIHRTLSIPGISRWIDNEFTSGVNSLYFLKYRGEFESVSDTISLMERDFVPPPKPTGLSAILVDSQYVQLSWDRSSASDIEYYEVERLRSDGDYAGLKISGKDLKDTVFIDKFKKNSLGSNYYRVFAIDKSFNYSEGSDLAEVRLPDNEAPQSPPLKRLDQKGDSIFFSWDESPDKDIDFYKVYRGSWPGELEAITETGNISYTETKPDSGRYMYSVSAIDTAGNSSSLIDTLYVTIGSSLPEAPIIIGVSPKGSGLEISWESSENTKIKRLLLIRIDPVRGTRLDIWQGGRTSTGFLDKYANPEKSWEYILEPYDQKWRAGISSKFLYEGSDE